MPTPSAPRRMVAVLAFAGIVVSLMQTLVIPLVSQFPALLHAPATRTAWIVTATLLAGAIATPVVGRLGDMVGKRRMLLVSTLLVVAGSVVGGLAHGVGALILARTLQGLAAGVVPLGISIMRDELPAERLGSGMALMSGSLGVGGALGLPFAALVAQYADWHVLFWTAAVLGAIATALILAFIPESPVRAGRRARFDYVGAAGISAGLICLLLPLAQGAAWGWSAPPTLATFAAALIVLAAWGFWEWRTPQPLVDLRTTIGRQVLLTNVASIVFGFAMYARSLVFPQLLQLPTAAGYGLGQSIIASGLELAPTGLVMMAMAPVSARISKARGAKTTLMLGAAVVAVGYVGGLTLMGSVAELILFSCVIGAGIGLTYGAMPTLIMAAVPITETAAANSFNTLMRAIGTATASAITGAVLAQSATRIGPITAPSQGGFQLVLAIAVVTAVAAIAICAFLPRRRPTPQAAQEPVAAQAAR